MIRPQPARWFAILSARDDAAAALEALARTGAVELEATPDSGLPASLAELRPRLSQFAELSLRYHAYWPGDRLAPRHFRSRRRRRWTGAWNRCARGRRRPSR